MKKNIFKCFAILICGVLALSSCVREEDYPEKIVGDWELTEWGYSYICKTDIGIQTSCIIISKYSQNNCKKQYFCIESLFFVLFSRENLKMKTNITL